MIICNLRATSIFPCSSQLAISHRYQFFVSYFSFESPTNLLMPSDLKYLSCWDINTFSCLPSFPASRTFHPNEITQATLKQWRVCEAHAQAEPSDPGPVIISTFPWEATPGEVPGPSPAGRSGAAPRLPIPGALLPPAAAPPLRAPPGPGPGSGPAAPPCPRVPVPVPPHRSAPGSRGAPPSRPAGRRLRDCFPPAYAGFSGITAAVGCGRAVRPQVFSRRFQPVLQAPGQRGRVGPVPGRDQLRLRQRPAGQPRRYSPQSGSHGRMLDPYLR